MPVEDWVNGEKLEVVAETFLVEVSVEDLYKKVQVVLKCYMELNVLMVKE